ncbi:DNA replication/repair protein RecF [Marinococcus sp. PL1-022]|uniref:DNA replication/repair protein RecF n=1 Tax=Marinococcus sp. PL1-022 TaxID=3095363 RepID=UPI0026369774|nr:DNA replication/repair protein RecF [Marinococcus sp. PL1-022]MDX6154360.1 DNA replication/repair protein RecF [Marinococcus sp. PL1-022]
MYVKNIRLKQYRNYGDIALQIENTVNVIVGENAQGKTNLMEAIHMLAFAKSHRTSKDRELIGWDHDFARIEASVEREQRHVDLEVILSAKGKKVKKNGIEQKKLSEYIGACNVVMFAPEDLNLVKGGPNMRRRFIDMEIGQISPVYLHDLSKYQRILKQRNQLLKGMFPAPSREQELTLEVIDEQYIEAAVKVIQRRYGFLQQLEGWASEIHTRITQDREQLKLQYDPSANIHAEMEASVLAEQLRAELERRRENEIRRGLSLAGPHRDEMKLLVNDRDVQTYGSQGQQRTAALSLKMAEIELIRSYVGEYPILLLDDVLSELDQHRQSHLLDAIQGKVQTFVTTTSIESIKHETIERATVFTARQGQLEKQ